MKGFFFHLKIMLRNMRREGIYTAINVIGLTAGITACLLIMFWVQDELSFDKFHARGKHIFQTNTRFKEVSGNEFYWNIACAPLAFAAKDEIPEIENACRYFSYWGADMLKSAEEEQERIVTGFSNGVVDSTFFSLFDFPILEGDVRHMLVDDQSVVLSASIARQLFGDESPTGKILYDNNRQEYHVTGVMADMPQNSSIRFDILLPFCLYEHLYPNELTDWGIFNFRTWFLLQPGSDAATVEKKLTELQNRHTQDTGITGIEISYELQSFEAVNFHNADGTVNAKAQTCRLFLIIAFVVILIACVNYVNISTAMASRRNKEVFVKNILGVRKWKLFLQFLYESILLFFLSLVVVTIFLPAIFPVFNQIAGKQLEFDIFSKQTWIVFGLTFLTVVLCAGIYPAINLAVKNPLQGVRNKMGNVVLRRVLVVGQFVVAVVLIVVTIGSAMQLEYIKKKDIGYTKENVLCVQMPQSLRSRCDAVKSELMQNAAITGVTATSMPLKGVTSTYLINDIEGSDLKDQRTILLYTDKDFVSTMDVALVAGRNFDGTPADAFSVILNETAVNNMNIDDPIAKKCNVAGVEGTIIGVVSDFHFKDLHTPIETLSIMVSDWRSYMYVRTSANNASQAIAAVEKLWKMYETELPFSYYFIDDEFDAIYRTDLRAGILFSYFSIIAILVSCLGLFGLVTYIAETKTKEIGIRKVLGASVSNIVSMLSKEFLILVGIAMLIAFPLAYYWLDRMLQDYAYRIDIDWWMFAAAGVITIVLTIIAVGWQAIKAATQNPVKCLKTE